MAQNPLLLQPRACCSMDLRAGGTLRHGDIPRAWGTRHQSEDREDSALAAVKPSDCSHPFCPFSPGDLPDVSGAVATRQGAAHDLPRKVEKPAGCLLNPIILLSGTRAKVSF